jgi:putative membrane protein
MSMTRRVALVMIGVLVTIVTASAHVPESVTPDRLWRTWTFEPFVVLPLCAVIVCYRLGVARMWRRAGRGRGVSRTRTLSFAAGITALVAALVSPLDALGGTLLSAHMAQHGLLAGVAPPLLLFSRPALALAWGLIPPPQVKPLASSVWRALSATARLFAAPALATLLHGIVLWIWHAPMLFGAAVAYDWVHALQHLSFFVTAIFFWRSLLGAEGAHRIAIATLAAFVTFMHTGLLGGLITMAPAPLYPSYFGRTDLWGMTALEDQQLAGLLMWVPLGVPYAVAGLWLASRLITREPDTTTPPLPTTVARTSIRRETAS